jgi:hypothetical protein
MKGRGGGEGESGLYAVEARARGTREEGNLLGGRSRSMTKE